MANNKSKGFNNNNPKQSSTEEKGNRGNNNKKNSGNARRYGSFKKQFTPKGAKSGDTTALSGLNDMSWYNRYPELITAASRIPFPYVPGRSVPLGSIDIGTNTNQNVEYDLPGVAVMGWIPSFGYSAAATDPTSVAAREIYSRVRSKFSSSLDADAPDFIMYIGALDSIFAYIGALKRIYRVIDTYSPLNFIMPDRLLLAMGVNDTLANELRANKANFNFMINNLVRLTRKFVMPNAMDLFTRHYWLNDNVYTDAPSIISQFFVFRQDAFYKYASLNTPDSVPAAGLTLVNAPWESITAQTTQPTMAILNQFGLDLINTLSGWDDCYTISGYLMRAYEGASQFIVDELPIDTEFKPAYVPEVLTQIHNSKCVLTANSQSVFNIKQTNVTQDPKTNAVLYAPYAPRGSVSDSNAFNALKLKEFMNMPYSDPSKEDIVIATRLHNSLDMNRTYDSGNGIGIIAGTEIVTSWAIVDRFVLSDGQTKVGERNIASIYVFNFDTAGDEPWTPNDASKLAYLFKYSNFRHAPLVIVVVGLDNDADYITMVGDVQNFTSFTTDTLAEIHRVCTYSELNAFSE